MKAQERIITDIWYEFEQWSGGYDENDCNSDVVFELSDGSRWVATFYTYQNLNSIANKNKTTGECLCGEYFYADKPIFISKMKKEIIISVLNDIISHETDLSYVFGRIEKHEEIK